MNNTSTDTKLIARVRKLFAMANDTASPNEAAIALKRAKSLMDTHGITEDSLKESKFSSKQAIQGKRIPQYFTILSLGITRFTDTVCQGVRCYGITEYIYSGYDEDVVLADLMQEYLLGAMQRHWDDFKTRTTFSGRKSSNSFKVAWCSAVQARLIELAEQRAAESQISDSSGQSLITMKLAIVNAEFGEQLSGTAKSRACNSEAYAAGRTAGQNVSLNSQVSGAGQKQLT